MKKLPISETKKEELIAVLESFVSDVHATRTERLTELRENTDNEEIFKPFILTYHYNEMIETLNFLIHYIHYEQIETLKLAKKELELLYAMTKNEFPFYTEEIHFIKNILLPFNEMQDLLKSKKYNANLSEIIEDEEKRYNLLNVVTQDIVTTKKLINSETEDSEYIKEKENKVKDLKVIASYIASIEYLGEDDEEN